MTNFYLFLAASVMISTAAYTDNSNTPPNPLAHWCFDNDADSETGTANAYRVARPEGGKMLSLGGDGYISQTPGLVLGKNMSLTLWIKPNSFDLENILFDQQANDGSAGFRFSIGNNSILKAYLTDQQHLEVVSINAPVPLNEWSFLAFVVEDNQVVIYVGNPKTGALNKRAFSIKSFSPNAYADNRLTIGANTQETNGFKGNMDDVAVFGRSLAYNEVEDLFKQPLDCSGKGNNPSPNPQPIMRNNNNPNNNIATHCDTVYVRDTVFANKDCPNPLPSLSGGVKVKYQHTIFVRTPDILLFPFDHAVEDSDTVSINVGGVWIAENYRIAHEDTKNPRNNKTFKLSLQPYVEYPIVSYAHNIGTFNNQPCPPNTLTIRIMDKKGNTLRQEELNSLPVQFGGGECGALKIVYIPD